MHAAIISRYNEIISSAITNIGYSITKPICELIMAQLLVHKLVNLRCSEQFYSFNSTTKKILLLLTLLRPSVLLSTPESRAFKNFSMFNNVRR